jgi:hypothetical protein
MILARRLPPRSRVKWCRNRNRLASWYDRESPRHLSSLRSPPTNRGGGRGLMIDAEAIDDPAVEALVQNLECVADRA